MLRKALVLACLVCCLSTVSFGQVTLEQKFTEGSTYTVETTSKTEQKMTIAGMEIDTGGDTRTTVKTTVGKRDAEGKLRVTSKVESLTLSISVMGMTYHFDSANPDNKGDSQLEMLRDVHKAAAKKTTTYVYDKLDRPVAVESDPDNGYDSLPAEVRDLVKSQADPDTLKKAMADELAQLKSDPINKGDTWQRTTTSAFGAGQVMTFQTDYKYEGTIEKDGKTLDKITTKTTSVTFALENSPLPFSVKDSDLKPVESEGVILFDRKRGQTVESNSSIRITGDMTFMINGMDFPVKLDLKIQSGNTVKE